MWIEILIVQRRPSAWLHQKPLKQTTCPIIRGLRIMIGASILIRRADRSLNYLSCCQLSISERGSSGCDKK